MRLKVLPPTLRKNNRYLTLDIRIMSESIRTIWSTSSGMHASALRGSAAHPILTCGL